MESATTVRAASPLIVFSDDWGRHPSSCQHLVRQLLPRRQVLWVNTIGTRKPRLDWATLVRGFEKIRHWLRPRHESAELPPHMSVLNPKMWPWLSSGFDRWLNRTLLTWQIVPALRSLPQPAVAVTTLPIVADLMGVLPVQRWVYYCVDDFGQWPGLDQDALRRMENQVIARADSIVAVSETLRERIASQGRSAGLLTHGVDLDFWMKYQINSPPAVLESLERPLIMFWGVVDRRMDVEFLRHLTADLERGSIVLVGPEAGPDPLLRAISRVVRIGPQPPERLPTLAAEASVLVMPYADLPVTRAMQPLKLKEYLATGKPAVVRDLPATRGWADCLDLADSPDSFTRLVLQRIDTGLPFEQRQARTRLRDESWAAKAEQFEKFIDG